MLVDRPVCIEVCVLTMRRVWPVPLPTGDNFDFTLAPPCPATRTMPDDHAPTVPAALFYSLYITMYGRDPCPAIHILLTDRTGGKKRTISSGPPPPSQPHRQTISISLSQIVLRTTRNTAEVCVRPEITVSAVFRNSRRFIYLFIRMA